MTLAGDGDPVPQRDRPEVLAIIAEPDPVRKLARFAAMAAGIESRTGPVHRVLRAAAAVDAGAAELVAQTEQERLTGSRVRPSTSPGAACSGRMSPSRARRRCSSC